MDERSAFALLTAETDVADNVQSAKDRREHTFWNKRLAQQVMNHEVDLKIKKYFANFKQRRVRKIDQCVFKNFKSPMQIERTTSEGVK